MRVDELATSKTYICSTEVDNPEVFQSISLVVPIIAWRQNHGAGDVGPPTSIPLPSVNNHLSLALSGPLARPEGFKT